MHSEKPVSCYIIFTAFLLKLEKIGLFHQNLFWGILSYFDKQNYSYSFFSLFLFVDLVFSYSKKPVVKRHISNNGGVQHTLGV